MSKKKREKPEKSGGLAFFLSLLAISGLALLNLNVLPGLISRYSTWQKWLWFSGGGAAGFLIAHFLIKGNFSVMLHEFRHSIISNLVGNKWKKLVVNDGAGHFEYAYSKQTARFNAFIALAPYWLPLFTLPGLGIAHLIARHDPLLLLGLSGIFYGIDLTLNLRDISPIQTDLTEIRGGYSLALCYVIAVNVLIFSLLAAWVSGGTEGLKYLGSALWLLAERLIRAP